MYDREPFPEGYERGGTYRYALRKARKAARGKA